MADRGDPSLKIEDVITESRRPVVTSHETPVHRHSNRRSAIVSGSGRHADPDSYMASNCTRSSQRREDLRHLSPGIVSQEIVSQMHSGDAERAPLASVYRAAQLHVRDAAIRFQAREQTVAT